jgi:hypothetical protein
MKKLNKRFEMKEREITVNEVKDILRNLGEVLGLVEEEQESSLKNFTNKFSTMDEAEASMKVLNVVTNPDYISDFAELNLEKMTKLFSYRTEEDIREKLMRTESIGVAVAMLILQNINSDEYIDWLFETTPAYINNNDNYLGAMLIRIRLDAVLSYLKG